MYKILLLALLAIGANAGDLTLTEGRVGAHTEVFGDSAINPETTMITSALTIDDFIESIRGEISITALSLKSDNDARDEHMYEAIKAQLEKFITVRINKVAKDDKGYVLSASLTLNRATKDINSSATIARENATLKISGAFSVNMTDYNIAQPKMFFLTVRNQVDITYELNYKEK